MKKYLDLLLLLLCLSFAARAQRDTFFLDRYELPTTRDSAMYFHGHVYKDGKTYRMRHYFMNGRPYKDMYVRSAKRPIPHGPAAKYFEDGRKEEYGNYDNGRRTGEWVVNFKDTDMVWAVINYFPGSRDTTETLVSYYRNGKLKRKQWTVDSVTTGVRFDENGTEIAFTPFMVMPEYPGDVNKFLQAMIRYPEPARRKGQQGRALVVFTVDTTGAITDVHSYHKYTLLADEAARAVKLMPRWKPGVYDDKIKDVHFTLPVLFKLTSR